MKFRIIRDVLEATGFQSYTVEANSSFEALEKFSNSEGELEYEEIEVGKLEKVESCIIEKIKESPQEQRKEGK